MTQMSALTSRTEQLKGSYFGWAYALVISLQARLFFAFKHVSLHTAKILTVFVLPVNSCANPFLYTIFTKQFKKDCYMILSCF